MIRVKKIYVEEGKKRREGGKDVCGRESEGPLQRAEDGRVERGGGERERTEGREKSTAE